MPEDPIRDEGFADQGFADDGFADDGFANAAPPIAHDDIMTRLLAYRQRLRADARDDEVRTGGSAWTGTPSMDAPPAVVATEDLVDVGSAEVDRPSTMVSSASGEARATAEAPSTSDIEGRMADLASTLERVDAMLRDLRRRFQELAVSADERIAAVREALAEARGENETP